MRFYIVLLLFLPLSMVSVAEEPNSRKQKQQDSRDGTVKYVRKVQGVI